MKTRLISYSQPVKGEMVGFELPSDLIAYCARVSNPDNQYSTDNDKLLNYLKKHSHWSPFEMVSVCIEIETTRDIARQMLRHRSMSFQEYSQRYANPTIDLDFVLRETRMQDPKNRQNSIEIKHEDGDRADILAGQWHMKQQQIIHEATLAYQWAIEQGIAKEQARVVLPEGNTISRLYSNATMRSWIHYCDERRKEGVQKEHRLLANNIADTISKIFPYIKE